MLRDFRRVKKNTTNSRQTLIFSSEKNVKKKCLKFEIIRVYNFFLFNTPVSKLAVFHPVVCTCNGILYLTVVPQTCGAMFLLCNYQLSDMFRPYRAIIRLYKIMVIRRGTWNTITCGIQQVIQSGVEPTDTFQI